MSIVLLPQPKTRLVETIVARKDRNGTPISSICPLKFPFVVNTKRRHACYTNGGEIIDRVAVEGKMQKNPGFSRKCRICSLDTSDTLDTRSGNSSIGLYRELSQTTVLSVQSVQPPVTSLKTAQLRNRQESR